VSPFPNGLLENGLVVRVRVVVFSSLSRRKLDVRDVRAASTLGPRELSRWRHLELVGHGWNLASSTSRRLIASDGWVITSDGWVITSDGWVIASDGWVITSNGWVNKSDGWATTRDEVGDCDYR
jgi:hypothetical protein